MFQRMTISAPVQPCGVWNDLTRLWTLKHGSPLPDGTTGWFCDIGKGRTLYIRDGTEIDGASVPRIAWAFVGHPLSRRLLPSALCHDLLYITEALPRNECDAIFYYHLRRRATIAHASACWSGVRVGGGIPWLLHKEADIAAAREQCWITTSNGLTLAFPGR